MGAVLHGDALQLLQSVADESVALVATDPPFNIGFKYGKHYDDNKPSTIYNAWTASWLAACYRILKPNGAIYVCQGDAYAAETKLALEEAGFYFRNWIIWYYRFGENQQQKFSRCHTHILYFTKSSRDFTFNADNIRQPSLRQTKYNDKRAKAGGKVPDDVWEFPRVCGTFKERAGYTTQMPEALMERIILASSNPGDVVVDPFGGTGTSAAVAARLKRDYWTCDVSLNCVSQMRRRIRDAATN